MTVNLRTLDGINLVREDTLTKVLAQEIPETRAVVIEKMLRGAENGQSLRVKFLGMVLGTKKFDAFAADAAAAISQFVNGPAALPPASN